MDWINKIHMIMEKMKNQMHAKQVDSLDKVFMAISKFDTENKGYVEKIYFEDFLAKIGIFLKTQELTEIHKYLYTSENENNVSFEQFINMLKCDIPENIIQILVVIFDSIQEGNNTVSLETFKKVINLDKFPRVKLMQKSKEQVLSEIDFSLLFVAGEKGCLEVNDFIDFHRNIYWVQPRENLTNFYKMVCDLWRYKTS